MHGKRCGAQIEVETSDFDPYPSESWTLVCTMTGQHETHRATLFWTPTNEEYEAMEGEDQD